MIISLDDQLIFSETKEDHFKHIQLVFECLAAHDVTHQEGLKCFLFHLSVNYLEFSLTPNGLELQSKKIDAIHCIAAMPKNKKHLRRFLGMINYYREMVPNKTMIVCTPLNQLTSKKVPFICGLLLLMKLFNNSRLLLLKLFCCLFLIISAAFPYLLKYVDASGKQIGGIIMQRSYDPCLLQQIVVSSSTQLYNHRLGITLDC